jgi:hypothetical protein
MRGPYAQSSEVGTKRLIDAVAPSDVFPGVGGQGHRQLLG